MNVSLLFVVFRVFFVDYVVVVCQWIVLFVGVICGVVVVGEVEDGQDVWLYICSSCVDVVIVDVWFVDGSGFDLIGMLLKVVLCIVMIVLMNYLVLVFREVCVMVGVDYFFDKIVEFDVVCCVIEFLVYVCVCCF